MHYELWMVSPQKLLLYAKLPNAVSITAWNNLFRLVCVETREPGKGKVLVAINSMFMDYGWHSKTVTLERINKELILKENKKNEAL